MPELDRAELREIACERILELMDALNASEAEVARLTEENVELSKWRPAIEQAQEGMRNWQKAAHESACENERFRWQLQEAEATIAQLRAIEAAAQALARKRSLSYEWGQAYGALLAALAAARPTEGTHG